MTAAPSRYPFLHSPSPPPGRGSITGFVTDALRRAIVTLDMPPGETIDKAALCERFGVSRFPVSEALGRLQLEGLVEVLPQRGSRVSRVRIGDVLEHMLIRKALEAEAARVVAGRRSAALLAALEHSMHEQQRALVAADRPRFHEHDLAFHDAILGGPRFARLKAVVDSSRAVLDRARRLVLTPRRLEVTLAEHQRIVDAVAAGDGDGAARAMRDHIDSVMAELAALARADPTLFADGVPPAGAADMAHFPFG